MLRDKITEAEIMATLNCLDNISPAQPTPFFYTRVRSRLEKKQETIWNKLTNVLSNPAFAIAMIALVISLDGVLLLNKEETSTPVSENSISAQYIEFYDTNQDFYSLTYDDAVANRP
jgi:hypothetical protein